MMEIEHSASRVATVRAPSAKYLSGVEIDNVITLLLELRDVTLSRGSFAMATRLISEIGGAGRLPTYSRLAGMPRDGSD